MSPIAKGRTTMTVVTGPAWLLRIHEREGAIPGPWAWSCTVEDAGDGWAKIHLAERAPTRAELDEAIEAVRSAGFLGAMWERHRAGRPPKVFRLIFKEMSNG